MSSFSPSVVVIAVYACTYVYIRPDFNALDFCWCARARKSERTMKCRTNSNLHLQKRIGDCKGQCNTTCKNLYIFFELMHVGTSMTDL